MTARLPTFFIIGAAKSGTTSLYAQLRSHPQIFMSDIKEPNYFAFADGNQPYKFIRTNRNSDPTVIKDLESYHRLFANATTEKVLGEASVVYLYLPWCAEKLRRDVPAARLVVLLRNPAERAYSQHQHAVRDGYENLTDFEAALDAEPERIRQSWSPIFHYATRGLYFEQLTRYYEQFDPERIRVHLYDDYRRDPMTIIRDVYGFLGVDTAFAPELNRAYNVSGVPKNRSLYRAYQKIVEAARRRVASNPTASGLLHSRTTAWLSSTAAAMMLDKPPMAPSARARLTAYYRDDVEKLEPVIGRDLSAWK